MASLYCNGCPHAYICEAHDKCMRPLEHPVDILHDQLVQAHGADKVDHKSFEEAKRSFDAIVEELGPKPQE